MAQYIRPLPLDRLTEEGQQSDPLSITVPVHCLWCWKQMHYTWLTHSGGLWVHRLVKVYKPLHTIWPGYNLHNIIILQPFIQANFHAESIVNIFQTSPMSSPKCSEISFQQRKCPHCRWNITNKGKNIAGHTKKTLYKLYSSLKSLCMWIKFMSVMKKITRTNPNRPACCLSLIHVLHPASN